MKRIIEEGSAENEPLRRCASSFPQRGEPVRAAAALGSL